jgi:hypothetical protein
MEVILLAEVIERVPSAGAVLLKVPADRPVIAFRKWFVRQGELEPVGSASGLGLEEVLVDLPRRPVDEAHALRAELEAQVEGKGAHELLRALVGVGERPVDRLRSNAFLKGLPDDRCQCEHWGYVIKGKVSYQVGGGEETFETGEAYYVPPGHTPTIYAGTELVEFSPPTSCSARSRWSRRTWRPPVAEVNDSFGRLDGVAELVVDRMAGSAPGAKSCPVRGPENLAIEVSSPRADDAASFADLN